MTVGIWGMLRGSDGGMWKGCNVSLNDNLDVNSNIVERLKRTFLRYSSRMMTGSSYYKTALWNSRCLQTFSTQPRIYRI